MSRPVRWLIAAAVLAAVSAFTSTMLMLAWPGAFELTGPWLCPDDQPDTFVVEYSVQTRDGTGTNFTLFCMGEGGQFTEVGTWKPLGLVTAGVTGGMLVLVAAIVVLARLSRAGAAAGAGPGPQDGPVVGPPVDAPIVNPSIVDPPL